MNLLVEPQKVLTAYHLEISAASGPYLCVREQVFQLHQSILQPKTSWLLQQREVTQGHGGNSNAKRGLQAMNRPHHLLQADLVSHWRQCQQGPVTKRSGSGQF